MSAWKAPTSIFNIDIDISKYSLYEVMKMTQQIFLMSNMQLQLRWWRLNIFMVKVCVMWSTAASHYKQVMLPYEHKHGCRIHVKEFVHKR